jgi:hypothetical protein
LQNVGEFQPGFMFQRINPWTGSMPPWTGRAHLVHRGPMAAWTEGGGRGAVARSPELGLRPLRCTKAHWRGRKRERGARGARLGPHQSSGGGVATERRRWCDEVTGNSVGRVSGAGEERRRMRRGVDCSGGHQGGFYRAGGGRREGWPE